MRLDRLAGRLAEAAVHGDGSVAITSVVHALDDVVPGSLFCCVPGAHVDGHDLAEEAVGRGAAALVVERELEPVSPWPQIRVRSTRAAMGPLAAALHGDPSHSIPVYGVTGTNGKTTTVALLAAILEAAGMKPLTIGSLSPQEPGRPPNTPEAPELQARLAQALRDGHRSVVMEVSSIGLAQHRVDGVRFAVGVFTNLTQDHLEFHGDMETYFRAKRELFSQHRISAAVVNADDSWGRRLLDELRDVPFPVTTFSSEDSPVEFALPGEHNQANAHAALAVARAIGIDEFEARNALAGIESVPGRMERIEAGQGFHALVDYAHTPDALEKSLEAARSIAGSGRVIVVFGCGGDRDVAKRPLMGAVATRLADLAVLTSDNPRSEDPVAIIDAVRKGADLHRLAVEPDRRAAIEIAVEEAAAGDVVLVAGKGHETGQEIGGRTTAFDDRVELAAAIGKAQSPSGSSERGAQSPSGFSERGGGSS